MKCNQFENNLADWVRQRLPEDQSSQMKQHAESCKACAKEELLERGLSAAWMSLAEPSPTPELWPKVAARMERPIARPWFGFGLGRFAMGGTLAAGALCAVLFMRMNSGPDDRVVPPGGGQTVLTMVAQMRELPEADPDSLVPGSHKRRELMIGRDDRP
jgi:hypothetical protein